MESRVADNCRAYSIFRNKLLEKAVYQLPIYAEYSSTFHSIVLTTSVICIVAIYAQLRSLTLFSLHPTCMIIGTFIFLAEGIVAYHNRSLLDTLSPIMQHNKKTKVRTLHQSIQIVGFIFLCLGLLFIVANKVEFKHSIVPSSVHSITGTATLSLIVIQIITGHQKVAQLERNNTKIRRWHDSYNVLIMKSIAQIGDLGLLIWDMLCLAVLTGLMGFFKFNILHLIVEMIVLVLWLAVHVQFRRKMTDKMDNQISTEDVDNDYPIHQPIAVFDDFDDDANRTRDV